MVLRVVFAVLISSGWLLAWNAPVGADDIASPSASSDWNQWRGPNRDGRIDGPTWPSSLAPTHLKQSWHVDLQPSYSGPIVSGNRVFTTETVDEKFERVTALDRRTGEILWTQQWTGSMSVPFFARSNGSWIRSTPACDGETLFVGGMRDLLVAIDVATGEVRWQVDFVKQLEADLPAFGFVCSPLIDGDELYVQAGGGVVKLDKRTGAVIWRSLRDGGGMNGSAFSSPVITTLNGQRQLVVQTRQQLAGVSLDEGKVLWAEDVPSFRGMNILTPTFWEGKVFTSSYGGKSFLYDVTLNGQAWQVSPAWENKVQGYMSSPVVHEGHAYVHLRNRRFVCLDLSTGKDKWTTTPFGEYWSMIAQGDRILALDERGELLLIRANPVEFELLERRKVSDEAAWAHLAYDQGQIFVRDLKGLTCFQWETPEGE